MTPLVECDRCGGTGGHPAGHCETCDGTGFELEALHKRIAEVDALLGIEPSGQCIRGGDEK
jgi:DnaJ-class molecular chaperone